MDDVTVEELVVLNYVRISESAQKFILCAASYCVLCILLIVFLKKKKRLSHEKS